MVYILITSLFLSLFGQINRISLTSSIHFYLYEPILFLSQTFWIIANKNIIITKIKKSLLGKMTLMIIFYLLFSWLISVNNYNLKVNLIAGLYLGRLISYFVFYYIVVELLDLDALQKLKVCIKVFTILAIFIAICQYIFYPDLRNLAYQGWDPHLYRIFGTYLEPVVAATIYGLLFIFWLTELNKYSMITIKFIIGQLLLTGAIFLTYSRIVIISLALVLSIYFFYFRLFRLFIFIIFSFLILFTIYSLSFLTTKSEGLRILRTKTIYSRFADFQVGIKIYKNYPLFGIGYNRLIAEKGKYIFNDSQVIASHSAASLHSSFLLILTTGGIFGLLLFSLLIIEWGKLNIYTRFAVFFLAVVSLADNVILHPFILLLFPILARTSLFDK